MNKVGEGVVGKNEESRNETRTLPYVKQTTDGNLLNDPGSSNLVLSDNLEGWDGVIGGKEVQDRGDRKKKRRGTHIPMADSCRCMSETNIKL